MLRDDNDNEDHDDGDEDDGDEDDEDEDDGDEDDGDEDDYDNENRAICYASGDPHYKTFDQRFYDFQGNCEYILTKPCNSSSFSVIVRNWECNTYVTCTEQVTVLIPGESLEIILGRGNGGTVMINGEPIPHSNDGILLQSPAVEVVRSGGRLHILLINDDVTIFWDGRHRVEVKVSSKWQGKLCGLCGNYNLNKADDFQTPDGELTTTADSFGNSWLYYNDGVSSGDCVGLPDPPTCPETDRNEANQKCNILVSSLFEPCHGTINPDEYIANCEYDYCFCKEEERDECYCESLTMYAAACAAAGVILDWRSDVLCRK